jgi:hypothetical protein
MLSNRYFRFEIGQRLLCRFTGNNFSPHTTFADSSEYFDEIFALGSRSSPGFRDLSHSQKFQAEAPNRADPSSL